MKKTVIVGTNTLLAAALLLYRRGELTKEQYAKMVERNNAISEERKKDTITLKE